MDAVWPTASTHDAVSVPMQPDAPYVVNPSISKPVGKALGLPLACTGTGTVMLAGRDASAGLGVAHELTLMARVQVIARQDDTCSVGAGDSTLPGSAVSVGVDAHDTANVVAYMRLMNSVEAAPAAFTTSTNTTG